MIELSVVICTHNPRPGYLVSVVNALRNQTLPKTNWELLVIDNASKAPIASLCDVSWHPNARHIAEPELGLAPARRRGIAEAGAKLLVFVDDDNILDENYLEEALKIERDWPILGAWGAGSIRPDFEVAPPPYTHNVLPTRESSCALWSNVISWSGALPWGCGLCVRAAVAAAYSEFSRRSAIQIIGHKGALLLGGDDIEIAFTACKNGFGMGVFPELKLTHLFPKERLSKHYLLKLAESTNLTNMILRYKWEHTVPTSPLSPKTLLSIVYSFLMDRGIDRRFHFAWVRALIKSRAVISEYQRQWR